MIRRNKRYLGVKCRNVNPVYPVNQTSQMEPNLYEILVAYQRGDDVSDYIRVPAVRATSDLQFRNRECKVDYLTEMQDYIKKEVNHANRLMEDDKNKSDNSNNKQINDKQINENKDIKE